MAQITVPRFKYIDCSISDLRIKDQEITINGCTARSTQRFWDSISSKYGLGGSVYRYFTPQEVFERLTIAHPERVRITIQETQSQDEKPEPDYKPRVLGISSAKNPCLKADELYTILNELRPRPKMMETMDGVIISRHDLHTPVQLDIGDLAPNGEFQGRLTLETPVDGYGRPNVWLTLYRKYNGSYLVAYHKKYQTGINVGKHDDAAYTLQKVMEAYSNEDGFLAIRDRLTMAHQSWASVWEAYGLTKLIMQFDLSDFTKENPKERLPNALNARTGDMREIYGIVQLDSLGEKKLRSLPTKAKVSDVISMAAEIATYWLKPYAARKVQVYCGELLGEEYDLEGSGNRYKKFSDFMIPA